MNGIRALLTMVSIAALALLPVAGCESQAQRDKAVQDAAIRREGADEIKRICALPEPERDQELQKLRERSGVVLYCGGP